MRARRKRPPTSAPWVVLVGDVLAVQFRISLTSLGRLPGIGPKSAHASPLTAEPVQRRRPRLARARDYVVKERVSWCPRCFNIAEGAPEGRAG